MDHTPKGSSALMNLGLTMREFLLSIQDVDLVDHYGDYLKGILVLPSGDAFIQSIFEIDGVVFVEVKNVTKGMEKGTEPIPEQAMDIIDIKKKFEELSRYKDGAIYVIQSRLFVALKGYVLTNEILSLN